MSKIQSESNSQRIGFEFKRSHCCDQYVKDTIWKQFTTSSRWVMPRYSLWPICQRYNLKAIHNVHRPQSKWIYVVTNMSKIQSESNSQQRDREATRWTGCDQYVKDTIWKQFTTTFTSVITLRELWPICQRYNLKAIHNLQAIVFLSRLVVTNMSKIQSESNSQRIWHMLNAELCCDQYVKDTIWKQFTTGLTTKAKRWCCDQYVKDTIWKQFTTYYWNLCPVL